MANATTVAVAVATYGLIAGCVIGGPIAASKIRKYDLRSGGYNGPQTKEVCIDPDTGALDKDNLM